MNLFSGRKMNKTKDHRKIGERNHELQTLIGSPQKEIPSTSQGMLIQDINHDGDQNSDEEWKKTALVTSYVSMVFTLGFGISFYVLSQIAGSPAAFGFAFAAILDTFSSGVVVWRFSGEKGRQSSDERERRAGLAIASCFILSSFAIAGKALYTLIKNEKPAKESLMEMLTSASFFVLLFLTCVKWYIASKVDSKAMRTDALNSLAGAVMTLGMIVSYVVCERTPTVCFLDSITAILIAGALFVYGVRTVVELHSKSEKRTLY